MQVVHANQTIDNSRINRFHISLIFWCFFIIVMDGYDVVIYGSVVPSLIEEWSISSVQAGMIGSYSAAGTAIGAVLFGLWADKIGRKRVILLCTIMFSVFTSLAGFANDPLTFTILRVIAGLGLGGVMPNVISLTTEYAPKKIRSAMVSFVFCGYSLGAIAAALISKSMLATLGWKPIFWIAGIPLLLLPFIIKAIPESTSFLLVKKKDDEIKKILKKVKPQISFTNETTFETVQTKEKGSPLVHLFLQGRALSTIMFWISCFCCFVLIYALNTWLPKLMLQAGYSLSSSLVFVAMMNVGAIVGTIVFGRLTDKWGFKKVMIPLYVLGAVALTAIGLTKNPMLAYLLIGIIGAASVGVQNISNAFVSQYYPPTMRSTGVGATMAFGRVGGIFAPTFVGVLLTMNLPSEMNFTVIAMAAILGGIAVFFVQERHAHYNQNENEEETSLVG
ncbi:aromatic acid/H+ symport family MFS transporter [Mesobacillus maritimus]|uniref:MFS transporter n=1 Tax=Mesobacillus maritimus TaxID=1643336 RepID=UPI00203A5D0A|nr:aromatic acid/H+ symport family MFS transporter [Mesobacillus maritimus]MCM3670768.1 aromatic acid/H+ symport family MFS transporter [Mesobacillus maritimus]